MNKIISNDDIFSCVQDFLPKIDYLKYDSDNVISDIHTISNLSLVSKSYNTHYLTTNNDTKKGADYKKILINSYELRKICEESRKQKVNINNKIAEYAFESIYKKYNIVKKKKTPLYNNFVSKKWCDINFTEKKYTDHIIIIYDFLELAVLAIEHKHSAINKKLKEVIKYYTILPYDVFVKYAEYFLKITTTLSIFRTYSPNTIKLLKVSTWTLFYRIIHINCVKKLIDILPRKKLEMIEELKYLSGTNRQFPKHFCKSLIAYYDEFL